MSLLEAAQNGNVQACWLHAVVFMLSIRPNRISLLFRSLQFISPTAANQHNPPHSSPPGSKYSVHTSRSHLYVGSLDMLCPNFVSLMCTHASTQQVQALLDKGVGPDDQKDGVRVCAATGSVSVHIRLVRVSVSVRVSVRVKVRVKVRVNLLRLVLVLVLGLGCKECHSLQ